MQIALVQLAATSLLKKTESATVDNHRRADLKMINWIYEVAFALIFIFPAYVANAIPVVLGGGRPMDFGRKMPDGKPVFGSHKTIRGFVAGVVAGTLTAVAQQLVMPYLAPADFVLPFQFSFLLGFVISLGALTGDLVHSFVKRRMNIVEGGSLPVVDQLDFVIGAVLFSILVSPPPLLTTIIIFVITLPIHLLTNIFAYVTGAKKAPW
jgi:CDP-2,3-bis-(O-geranylgeranyl)-sn-glycerol synthase